jgi:hypothetical protein
MLESYNIPKNFHLIITRFFINEKKKAMRRGLNYFTMFLSSSKHYLTNYVPFIKNKVYCFCFLTDNVYIEKQIIENLQELNIKVKFDRNSLNDITIDVEWDEEENINSNQPFYQHDIDDYLY